MNRDKKKFPGLFIVFEGIDGTGKTTQIKKLLTHLQGMNYDVVSFYQPTHGTWGKKLRQLFVDGHIIPIRDEIQLSVNDRQESVERDILPALQKNKLVLLDRYYWSNAAYQGILDDTAYKRILNERKEIPNKFETVNNLQQSLTIYNEIISKKFFTGSLIIISAVKDPETVFETIKIKVMPLIQTWK